MARGCHKSSSAGEPTINNTSERAGRSHILRVTRAPCTTTLAAALFVEVGRVEKRTRRLGRACFWSGSGIRHEYDFVTFANVAGISRSFGIYTALSSTVTVEDPGMHEVLNPSRSQHAIILYQEHEVKHYKAHKVYCQKKGSSIQYSGRGSR